MVKPEKPCHWDQEPGGVCAMHGIPQVLRMAALRPAFPGAKGASGAMEPPLCEWMRPGEPTQASCKKVPAQLTLTLQPTSLPAPHDETSEKAKGKVRSVRSVRA